MKYVRPRMKSALIGIGGIAVAVWVLQVNDLTMTKVFSPRYEQVRRNTFEKSKAYNQGMIQELENMQFQYEQAGPEHRAALADLILHRSADFDLRQQAVPSSLQYFINKLRQERTKAR